jgi:hypothetical protein
MNHRGPNFGAPIMFWVFLRENNKYVEKCGNMWLNRNKKRLIKARLALPQEFSNPYHNWPFDYPDYWAMPRKISYRLNTDEVDWLQDEIGE